MSPVHESWEVPRNQGDTQPSILPFGQTHLSVAPALWARKPRVTEEEGTQGPTACELHGNPGGSDLNTVVSTVASKDS